MEIELSQQQQQQQSQPQYYYNSSNCHSYYHPGFLLQQHLCEEGAGVEATTMKNGDDIPAAYTPAYWSCEQFAPMGTDSFDLISDSAAAFLDIPPSPAGGDYVATACELTPQQDCSHPPLPPPASAFTPYAVPGGMTTARPLASTSTRTPNMNARVLDYLRRIDAERKTNSAADALMEDSGVGSGSTTRCFRHMMRERQRRERLSQSYADLYGLVSGRSKADKNSIVQASAACLVEMKAKVERLRRRNQELKARAAAAAVAPAPPPTCPAKIRLRVGNPCSSVDSVIGALRRLKGMGVRARSIRADVEGQELNAAIDVDTNMATAEVEAAVQGALVEVEKRLKGSGAGMNSCFDARAGCTVALSGGGSSATAPVHDSYTHGGTAGSFPPTSAPSHPTAQQLLPGSIVRWPRGYSSGSHVAFRHLS